MRRRVLHAINIFQGLIVVCMEFSEKLLEKNKRMRKIIITGPPPSVRVLHIIIIIGHRKSDPRQR